MRAAFKYYRLSLLLLCSGAFSTMAQRPDQTHLPPDTLLKIVCIDSGRRIPIKGTTIGLTLKDRIVSNLATISFEVMLEVKNTSGKTVVVPGRIDCFDDSGFNSDHLSADRGSVLPSEKTKNIALTVNCSRRSRFHRSGYVMVYVNGADYVRYPIELTAHFIPEGDIVQ